MSRALEKVLSQAIGGSRKAQAMADDLETMFEMWTGYMVSRLGEDNFFNQVQVFDDRSFNIDGYQPTIMAAPINLIEGMKSIGVDAIRPNLSNYGEESSNAMLVAEATSMHWLLFTIVEQGHPLKGLRYVVGYRDGELIVPLDDPMFTATYDDEHFLIGGRGCFIDKRERFLQATRPELFNER